jgi:hypothetical protein
VTVPTSAGPLKKAPPLDGILVVRFERPRDIRRSAADHHDNLAAQVQAREIVVSSSRGR